MIFDFKKLELSHRELFNRYLKHYQPQAGELTFTNLHTWDCVYHSYFTEYEGFLCIVCGLGEKKFSLTPIDGRDEERIPRLAKTFLMLKNYFESISCELVFKRITEKESFELEAASKLVGETVLIEFDRDNSDYVYLYEEMSSLQGKKYHAKRNHIQNLINNEQPEYLSLTPELLPDCAKIIELWNLDRADDEEMRNEKISQLTLLENFEKYEGLRGALIKVNGVARGYTIGEMLNNNTLVVHSEKADGSIRGLYPYLNQQHLLNEWAGVEFVNREQDCGSEGLRKAKLSYHPNHFVKKFTIRLELPPEIL